MSLRVNFRCLKVIYEDDYVALFFFKENVSLNLKCNFLTSVSSNLKLKK